MLVAERSYAADPGLTFVANKNVLLLSGLANAVRELAAHGFDGMQVHRSYWINWAHVRRLMVNSNGGFCELESGLRIPVSRRRAAAVQAAFDDYQSRNPF